MVSIVMLLTLLVLLFDVDAFESNMFREDTLIVLQFEIDEFVTLAFMIVEELEELMIDIKGTSIDTKAELLTLEFA